MASRSISFDNLNTAYITQMTDVFQVIDDDGDGMITSKDLEKTFKNLGRTVNPTNIKEMLPSNETLPFPEFLSLMTAKTKSFPDKAILLDCFKAFEDNGIGHEDLLESLRLAGFEEPEKQFEDILSSFSVYSQNKDEMVFKAKEFAESISK